MENKTFQRRKLNSAAAKCNVRSSEVPASDPASLELSTTDKPILPELTNPIYRAMLIKAYRRIEEQLQKREALRSN